MTSVSRRGLYCSNVGMGRIPRFSKTAIKFRIPQLPTNSEIINDLELSLLKDSKFIVLVNQPLFGYL